MKTLPSGSAATPRLESEPDVPSWRVHSRLPEESYLLTKASDLPALARKAQALLDGRAALHRIDQTRRARFTRAGWQQRSRELYDSAAAVARAK